MRLIPVLLLLVFLLLPQATNAGASDNLSGWAWSSTIGWVSFNSTTGGGANHGVNVAANGLMSGYAWSPNVGWISFNSSDLSGCPSGTCQASFDKKTGAVSGWARAIAGGGSSIQTGGWGGWIQLSGPSYAVAAAGCQWSGYAWGGGPSLDSGVTGWLSFSGPGYGVTGSGPACAGGTVNLTAGGISPTTATPNVARTYSSTVTNSGPAATGGSFPALFQRATDASGSNATDLGAMTIGNLTPGGTAIASMNATLAAGTWYLRACADKASSGDTGLITESSEVDNCGAWTLVTVSATPNPPSCTFGTSTTIGVGESATLTWSCTDTPPTPPTISCTGTGFSTGGAASGTTSVTPTITSSYGLSCVGPGGPTTLPPVTVEVGGRCTGTPTPTLTAVPNRVRKDSTSTLTWSGANVATSCVLTGPGINQPVTSTSCVAGPTVTVTPAITTQSTYCVSCDGGTPTCKTVNVIPNFQEF